MLTIKVNTDTSSLSDGFIKKIKEVVIKELIKEFTDTIGPAVVDRIMAVFDELADEIGLEEDPTSPHFWRNEFKEKLLSEARHVVETSDGISVSFGEMSYLGYEEGEIAPEDTEPLHWAVFWFEGLAGSYAFITPEFLAQVRGSSSLDGIRMGRFGEGFLISREDYEDGGFSKAAPFSDMEHPLSGSPPIDIFEAALSTYDYRPNISNAIKRAFRKFK